MILHFTANFATDLLTQLGLIYLLDGFAKPRFQFRFRRLASAALLAFVLAADTYVVGAQYRFVVNASIYMIAIFAYYRVKIMKLLLLWALNLSLISVGEAASFPPLLAMGLDPQTYTLTSWWLPVVNLTLDAVYWVLVLLVRSLVSAGEDRIDKKTWAMMGYCAFAVVLASFYLLSNTEMIALFISANTRDGDFFAFTASPAAALITVLLLIGLLLMMFSIIRRMNDALQKTQAAKRMAEEAELAAVQARETKEKLEAVARIRHDMKGHLLAVDALGQARDSQRQAKYLADLTDMLGKEDAAL